jgi:glutamyl-tRNA reductase
MLNLLTIGIQHQVAPVHVREKVAFSESDLADALVDLRQYLNQSSLQSNSEVAILSTCNRTEIYCAANDQFVTPEQLQTKTIDWLSSAHGIAKTEIADFVKTSVASDAVRHVFRVGCGLDSMVLGETQILGQIKKAVHTAQQTGSIGTYLNQLFHRTFAVAKDVRTNTQISTHAVSMASAAVRLSERVLGDIAKQRILFIGAGDMIHLCALYFVGKNPRSITIANRTIERGEGLAKYITEQGYACDSIALSDVTEKISQYDIVISCTASSLPIIGLGMVNTALKKRKFSPMVMIDLAVPRDIEPEISKLRDVYLYTVDDLGELVKEGNHLRLNAVKSAEEIIDVQVKNLMQWFSQRSSVPLINSLKQRSEELQLIELEKAKRKILRGEDPLEVMAELARALSNKFLHGSLHTLNHAEEFSIDECQKIVSKIFMSTGRKG